MQFTKRNIIITATCVGMAAVIVLMVFLIESSLRKPKAKNTVKHSSVTLSSSESESLTEESEAPVSQTEENSAVSEIGNSKSSAKPSSTAASSSQPGQKLPSLTTAADISTFFASVEIDEAPSVFVPSDGDLWPSAWSDDDVLYSALGDGRGFINGGQSHDLIVTKLTGGLKNLVGTNITTGVRIGPVWSGAGYNRKPTGMTSVDGNLFLAIQDLKAGEGSFDDAPAANIYMSKDKGKSWSGPKSAMFNNYKFTTIFFLDYGKDSQYSPDNYVYAYGLDYNWRDSFLNVVTDPESLYLARVHKSYVTDRSKWQFFNGTGSTPSWTSDINAAKPVLTDTRRVYPTLLPDVKGPKYMSVISQGSVVYNKPLNRYIYTSWTEYTFEFYESPTPYGPWKLFCQKDFGGYPWTSARYGGYAATIPSKFISADGSEMYIASATFTSGGVVDYAFSMRKMKVVPYKAALANNKKSSENLALKGTSYFSAGTNARAPLLNKGKLANAEQSYTGEFKLEDYWGYTYNKYYSFNKLEYTTGNTGDDGGWFENMKVQVRRGFDWVDVTGLKISPDYTFNQGVANKTFTLTFDETLGDGIRIFGKPGGTMKFTSIRELKVLYQ